MGMVDYELEQYGITDIDKSFETAEVIYAIRATREALDAFFKNIDRRVRKIQ
jgi:hypothetical protein